MWGPSRAGTPRGPQPGRVQLSGLGGLRQEPSGGASLQAARSNAAPRAVARGVASFRLGGDHFRHGEAWASRAVSGLAAGGKPGDRVWGL